VGFSYGEGATEVLNRFHQLLASQNDWMNVTIGWSLSGMEIDKNLIFTMLVFGPETSPKMCKTDIVIFRLIMWSGVTMGIGSTAAQHRAA
jgi:hypothetical protein